MIIKGYRTSENKIQIVFVIESNTEEEKRLCENVLTHIVTGELSIDIPIELNKIPAKKETIFQYNSTNGSFEIKQKA